MALRKIGNVARANIGVTVEELMGDVPKTGARYLDLRNGDLLAEGNAPVAEEPKAETKNYTEDILNGMKMSQLRKIGGPLGAKDTKKSELVAEILAKQ